MSGFIVHWETPDWPGVAYDIHDDEESAHRAALAKSTEIQGEVAVVPLSQYDTSRKRGEG